MTSKSARILAVALSITVLTAVPTRASGVKLTDLVVRALVNDRSSSQTVDLRLRTVAEQQGDQVKNTDRRNGRRTPPGTGAPSGPVLTPIELAPAQDSRVETIEVGEVTGTVCDCGEILLPPVGGGGFPLWPLLGLAAVPFFFINGDDDGGPPEGARLFPTATPPPATPQPPPQVPEPTTILLFGSGLLALGAERRRRRALLAAKIDEREVA
ncbi:MAG: PEP-CTERM sorting domain-containing protein [Pyrinomonadaceae bacterium]